MMSPRPHPTLSTAAQALPDQNVICRMWFAHA